MLDNIGITKNVQLARTTAQEIVDNAVENIKSSTGIVEIGQEEIDLMKKRAELWKIEAALLSER
jgi:hypothetical protein